MTTQLVHAIRWDLIRQLRYNVWTAAILITVVYLFIVMGLNFEEKDRLVLFLIFNDPVAMGMLFIGSLVLFERSERTLEALMVTPQPVWQYIFSKIATLTLLAWLCSLPVAIAGHGWPIHLGYFTLGIILTSVIFTSLGIIVVTYSQSFNAYMLKIGLLMIPTVLPFLNLWEITNTYWWYLIPVQGALILLEASMGKVLPKWEIGYGVIYLALCAILAFRLALRFFVQRTRD